MPYIWNHTMYSLFSDWLLWLSKCTASSMFFHGSVMHCFAVKMPLSRCITVYSSTAHFGLFQLSQGWTKLLYTSMCEFLDISFQLIWVNLSGAELLNPYGKSIVSFVRNCQTIFQMTVHFAFPQAMRIPVVSHPCQHLVFGILAILIVI